MSVHKRRRFWSLHADNEWGNLFYGSVALLAVLALLGCLVYLILSVPYCR